MTEHPQPLPDPEATSGAPPSGAHPARRRPWRALLLAVLAAALLSGAVGGGLAAWQSYDAGAAWEQRAQAEAERAEAAEAALTAERERTARLEGTVSSLEEEISTLEGRVVELAGEKAGAEDEALMARESVELLQETAERLAELSRFATSTGASLQRCIALSLELTDDIVREVNAGGLDAGTTNRRIGEVNEICGAAQAEYGELRRRVDALAE